MYVIMLFLVLVLIKNVFLGLKKGISILLHQVAQKHTAEFTVKTTFREVTEKGVGSWTVCRFKRGLGEKEGVVFLKRGKLGTTQARNSTVLLLLCVAASRPSELDSVKKCVYSQVQ